MKVTTIGTEKRANLPGDVHVQTVAKREVAQVKLQVVSSVSSSDDYESDDNR